MMPQAISPELTNLAVNTIKMLAVDAVERAQSGHPGLPMGAADYAFVLWMRYLRFNPKDPTWPNRDRFVLSAGHGSMLLYALLHLFGYDLSMEDLKQFRQWGSRTPGHPEYGLTPGVEATTGPLGQGFGNGVGMAIAAKMAAARYNTPAHTIVDHYVYGIVSDGDLMEGVASEAASLAGHLGLGNLIYFYDDNRISIEGSTDLAFTEDRGKRFEAYGWQVIHIDGHDGEAAVRAIEEAQADSERPTLIIARTHIAQGSPNKVDSEESHGAPLGAEEAALTKQALGWPEEPTFFVPDEVRELFARRVDELQLTYAAWQDELAAWTRANSDLAIQRETALTKSLPDDLEGQLLASLPEKPNATRRLSGAVLQRIAELIPYVVGGSADLSPSTYTLIAGSDDIARDSFGGRNFRFGVREHGMGTILNGLALYGGFIPYGATFLIFSDYMRPPIRLASLMGAQVIYVYTHDSIFLGEDGPTHQSVEQLASLRAIPQMTVIRPADGPEVAAAWAYALRHQSGPTALVFTRQGVPAIDRDRPFSFKDFHRGAYMVSETPGRPPDVVVVATGSEVQLGVAAKRALEESGYAARLVSMPSCEIYSRQDAGFRAALIPASARKVLIEAGTRFGWAEIVGADALFITQDDFGHSAPYRVLAEKLGFTGEQVVNRVLEWIGAG
ncbi:MAG: transketolase [Chloroflexi bacterium RBG_13_56_8]|nr:MAG: transketolase [Chloroflexi bacterium RBG_13_56_8]